MNETGAKLLDAATYTIRAKGVTNATARAIAARAQVNQALIFYHFGTVTALLEAACRQAVDDSADYYRRRFATVTSFAGLLGVGRDLHERERAIGNVALMAQLMAGAQHDPALATVAAYAMSRWNGEIEPVVGRVLEGGPLAGIADVAGLTRAITAGFIGLELYEGVDPQGAAAALTSLESLGLLVEVMTDLGPVARPEPAEQSASRPGHRAGPSNRVASMGQTGRMPVKWSAPNATGPVDATVPLPGSKSHTARALVLAALADGPSVIAGPLVARDSTLMAGALRALGVGVDAGAHGTDPDWTITPAPLHGGDVDTGLAGTVMRFLPPIAGLATGDVHIDGDDYARTRPMATLLDALRQAGIDIQDQGRNTMPFTIRGRGAVPGGVVEIDSSGSSQFVSALLLAGARWDKGVLIRHVGPNSVPSLPHVNMTVAALKARRVQVDDSTPDSWQVLPGPIGALDVRIEPDLSNAAPFLAAALITGGTVRVPGWPAVTDQAGDALRQLLTAMGARVELTDAGLTVTGTGAVKGIEADLRDVGELTPVLAALCALADSPSQLGGIAHLRGHETDRLHALATELNALGSDVTESPGGLAIRPRPLTGGTWHAYADHRMAQAGAVLGLAVGGVEIDGIASTTKTLADFPGMWLALTASGGVRPGGSTVAGR